jgi:hypothetical protein
MKGRKGNRIRQTAPALFNCALDLGMLKNMQDSMMQKGPEDFKS